MTNDKERMISLAMRIGELRKKLTPYEDLRKELAQCEEEFDSLVSHGVSSKTSSKAASEPEVIVPPAWHPEDVKILPKQSTAKGSFVPGSLADQIIRTMRTQPDRAFSSKEFINGEPGHSSASVRNALSRMVKNGQLVKTDRGYYQAVVK